MMKIQSPSYQQSRNNQWPGQSILPLQNVSPAVDKFLQGLGDSAVPGLIQPFHVILLAQDHPAGYRDIFEIEYGGSDSVSGDFHRSACCCPPELIDIDVQVLHAS